MSIDPKAAFEIERRALREGMYAALAMAVVGLGFAYAANSQAILFDGLFNVLLFFMIAIGLAVSRRINAGPDDRYHFGYGGYEPFLVLVRAAVALTLMTYASFLAVQTMLRGGAEVNGGLALVYSILLAIACAVVAIRMWSAYRKTGWPTMYSEFLTWVLNGVLSSATGIALFGAGFLRGTSAEWLVPYADSIVLLLLQLIMLPAPLQLLITSFLELAGRAPDEKLESQSALEEMLPEGFEVRVARTMRLGRSEFVHLEIATDPSTKVGECDRIRARWDETARDRFPNTYGSMEFRSRVSRTDPEGRGSRAGA